MAGRVQRAGRDAAEGERFVVGEQMVELAAVGLEVAGETEDLPECLLHVRQPVADATAAAHGTLHVGDAGQVVGVNVRFEHPFDADAGFADPGDHRVGRAGRGARRLGVVVEHGSITAARLVADP